jgi:hypothetical protein
METEFPGAVPEIPGERLDKDRQDEVNELLQLRPPQ